MTNCYDDSIIIVLFRFIDQYMTVFLFNFLWIGMGIKDIYVAIIRS